MTLEFDKKIIEAELTTKRLVWLGLISVLLTFSILMSFLAPYPLAMAMILYGRKKGMVTYVAGLLGLMLLGYSFGQQYLPVLLPFLVVSYLFSCLIAAAISEIILRKMNPARGVMSAGLSVIFLIGSFIGSLVLTIDGGIKNHIVNFVKTEAPKIKEQIMASMQGGGINSEEAIEWINRFSHPEVLATEYMHDFLRLMLMAPFLWVWAILVLVLGSHRIIAVIRDYPFKPQDLFNFKVADWVVYPLIVNLAFLLLAKDYFGETAFLMGVNGLYIFGVFYFFQGMGVIFAFLNHLGVFGFFRTLMVILLFFMAKEIIPLVGLFDGWFDFRKRMKKKDNEGESL